MKRKKGFTLIEVLIAVVLLGIGIIALVRAGASFTGSNNTSINISTAQFLISQIREHTAAMDFDNLTSLEANTLPFDVNGDTITDLSNAGYTQTIEVENVSSSDFNNIVAEGSSDFAKVTVTVKKNGKEITQSSWIKANY
jgi:prepilin-type N-terminal cleavage/methylation domain-containing protein